MRRSREAIAARQGDITLGATGTLWGENTGAIWTGLIPSGAPMVFGAAVIATHPSQQDKQHQALSSGIVTLGGPAVPWRVVSLCREMRCNFPLA